MDAKLARLKELIAIKESTDAEIETLLGGASPVVRRQAKCGKCGETGHNSKTCTKEAV